MGIEVITGIAKTGVIGLIRGKQPGITVAIRADMDALPVLEENKCTYKSEVPGKMHACGHDAHIACVLGAAEIINSMRDKLSGNVKLIFQPAEEMLGGAALMIKEGVLETPDVDVCIGAHVWPDVPSGKILVNYGSVFAAMDRFEIVIKGKGGHGAMPHMAIDPIVTGCQVVSAIQTIISRRVSPLDAAVISVCSFHSGSSNNVIPDRAIIKGSIRTLDMETREKIPEMMHQIIDGVTKSMGAEYELNMEKLVPVVLNDRNVTDVFVKAAAQIMGDSNIIVCNEPSMVSEDFSYFTQRVPSTYFRLGCGNSGKGSVHTLHSSEFDIDEGCILTGMEVFTQFAVDYLMEGRC